MPLIISLSAAPLAANIVPYTQLQDTVDDLTDLVELGFDVGVAISPWGRFTKSLGLIRTIGKARKAQKVNRVSKMAPKPLTPQQAGRLGRDLAVAKLRSGFEILAEEVIFLGKDEKHPTICDFVVKSNDRIICVEVKYGAGKFTPNQLRYHSNKNVSGQFKGSHADASKLSSGKPRTVWMKQMCFANMEPVTCKLK